VGGETRAKAMLPQPASRHALGLLKFPDRSTHWVVVLAASLDRPLSLENLVRRLHDIHSVVPMIGARLHGDIWHPGKPPEPFVVEREPLEDVHLDAPFELGEEAPLRVVLGGAQRRLALAGHHAAFDGLALVALLAAMLEGPLPAPVDSPPPGPAGSKIPALRRLVAPADRIAPSPSPPGRDTYASAEIQVSGRSVTARLAEACATAVAAHNLRLGAKWRRVGISIAKGGPAGVGNVASYRRIDVRVGDAVIPQVVSALASDGEPSEQTRAGVALALARPVVNRLSDSFLISNVGRQSVPGAARVEFFPVARGRSAVAFGALTVADGRSTLCVRARDLGPADGRALLEGAVAALSTSDDGVHR